MRLLAMELTKLGYLGMNVISVGCGKSILASTHIINVSVSLTFRLSGNPKDHMQMCQGRFALLNSQWRDTFESTKLKAILGLLQVIRQRKEKTIVFSQYTSLLSIVEEFLDQQGILTTRCKTFLCSRLYISF